MNSQKYTDKKGEKEVTRCIKMVTNDARKDALMFYEPERKVAR